MNVTDKVREFANRFLDFTEKDYSDKVLIIAKSKDARFRESYWIIKNTDKTRLEQRITVAKKHLTDQYKVFAEANKKLMLHL